MRENNSWDLKTIEALAFKQIKAMSIATIRRGI